MSSLEEILKKTQLNQADLYTHILAVERLVRQKNLKKVFINYSNEPFLAKYVSLGLNKITLNSKDDKHFKVWEDFDNVKYINKDFERVQIQDYDILHLNCNHQFEDWNKFLDRNIKNKTQLIVLSNSNSDRLKTSDIIQGILTHRFFIEIVLEGYNGCVILKRNNK